MNALAEIYFDMNGNLQMMQDGSKIVFAPYVEATVIEGADELLGDWYDDFDNKLTITNDGRANWLADATGRPLVDVRGTMCDRVEVLCPPCPTMRPMTTYCLFGDIPLAVSFALLIVSMVLVKYRNTYEKRRYLSM